ncbi:nucleotidyltransferase domain-containing protein [Candidatus Entotheonella palauensis]|uniref:Nucleotidyltransferase family protein n=1 Tax=Candidatus Entotheonella gemina TaxID=1429439 RepID=W4MAM9_9BACT|nr:nucleotidyltransferase family protein [Candidatus Entotheonella palauensis]ETX07419.1 MAG: hypothetical protein ETSY2_11390 [Candidatus Entotheonella gemina]
MTTRQSEINLLLTCAQSHLHTEHEDALRRRLSDDLDWPEVLRLARQHAVLPLLYHQLRTVAPQAVPHAVQNELRRRFRANLRRNLSMTAELLKILRMLEANGIAAIPYKGPVLAAAIYGDVALRQFGDLDILVKRQDVLKVKNLLLSQGYQPEFDLTPTQESAYLRSSCEYNFKNKTKGIHLEIHWRIVRPYFMFSLDTTRLWDHLEPVQLGGYHIQSLRPEELLLILCVHGSKHQWERIGWIRDVVQLLHCRRDIRWDQLIERSTRLGAIRILRLGLFLAHDLLGATLPLAISKWVRVDRTVQKLAAQVCEQLFQAMPRSPDLGHHAFSLKMRERWWDRIAYSCRLPGALTVEDLTFVPLPSYLSGLYYCLRPVRLLGKYAERLLQG